MILLLENKRDRIGGIERSGIQFTEYSEVILYDEKCNNILDNFLENNNQFDKYDTIIIHESIYYEEKRESLFSQLEKYARKENKTLVKFSGSNSQSSFSKNILTLSAEKLYQNLETFLKENNSNILILAYGRDWDLNPLLNTLEVLNIFIEDFEKDNEIDFDEFEDDFDLLELKHIFKEQEYQALFKNLDFKNEVSREEMIILASNLQMIIREKCK